ncbi:MAG TPA: hypothetical protein VEF34_05540 [Syntrophobacteraceae bacterium]|nr:hypothetical protein [Syntrophobacteraceae bacterium]
MKRTSLLISVCILLFCASAYAGTVKSGQVIFNTGPVGCNGKIKKDVWTAKQTTYIIAIQVWNGLDYGSYSDVIGNVVRGSDGAMLIMANHDDYTNGGSVRNQKQDWAGNLFVLEPGDTLIFSHSCSAASGLHNGAWIVTIWTAN